MKANIKNEYQICETKVFETSIEIDFEKLLKDVDIYNEGDLEEAIREIIFWSDDSISLYHPEDSNSIDDYFDESREIVNITELLKTYAHLIKEKSCCEKAPWEAIYCPTCGKKLEEDEVN